jgi:hypothetical protein
MPKFKRVDLPEYDELPKIAELGIAHSWEVYGKDDEYGTLNNLDDANILAALTQVKTGERIGLTLPVNAITPPLYGRQSLKHTLIQDNRNTWDDKLDDFYPQSSSQWDGFRHIRCREFGFYGGVTQDPTEIGERLGVQSWAKSGITGRGVLLDVERYISATEKDYDPIVERSITPGLLKQVAISQNISIKRGDILCLRFGFTKRYLGLHSDEKAAYSQIVGSPPYAGLSADEAMARTLWNWNVAAIACDNPGAEVSPGDAKVGNLHRRLLPGLGLVVGELFNFEELSDRCSELNRWDFLFVSVPTNIPGGIGSPANALAIL